MSLRACVFIATSLDGFIARKDGSLDWLLGAATGSDDHGYNDFIVTVDTLVMGRGTFDFVRSLDEWPYPGKRVIVLSSTLQAQDIPERFSRFVEIRQGPVREIVAALEAEGTRGIYVDGGKVIQSFLNEALLDEITITRIPVLIGDGIPLFGPLRQDIKLEHLRTKAYESGFVQSTYRVVK